MVSTKMAAVLAVALLLLCSSVRSSAQEVQATITQVMIADSATTAPAITNTTEGSSDSRSAVLANEVLEVDGNGPLVLVDLARSKQENMTSMSATPPTSDPVPSGFDMIEPDDAVPDSFAESTTPPAVGGTQDHGTLVGGYPKIGSSADNSQGAGYGVAAFDTSSAAAADESSFAVSDVDSQSFPGTQDHGTLVGGYPKIGSSADNSQGAGYGVQAYDETVSVADSFSAYQEDEYPVEHEDITDGPGFGGVRPYGPFYGQP